jgi:hypothetical protein
MDRKKWLTMALVLVSLVGAAAILNAFSPGKYKKRSHPYQRAAKAQAEAEYGCTHVLQQGMEVNVVKLYVCGKNRSYQCKTSWTQQISCKEIGKRFWRK